MHPVRALILELMKSFQRSSAPGLGLGLTLTLTLTYCSTRVTVRVRVNPNPNPKVLQFYVLLLDYLVLMADQYQLVTVVPLILEVRGGSPHIEIQS